MSDGFDWKAAGASSAGCLLLAALFVGFPAGLAMLMEAEAWKTLGSIVAAIFGGWLWLKNYEEHKRLNEMRRDREQSK